MPFRLTTPLLLIAALTGPVIAQTPPDDDRPVVVDPVPRNGPTVPGNIVRQDLVPSGRGLIREGA